MTHTQLVLALAAAAVFGAAVCYFVQNKAAPAARAAVNTVANKVARATDPKPALPGQKAL